MSHQLAFLLSLNYPSDGPGIRIPIKLTTGDQEIPLEAYLDTGAPRCIFPRWVGEELGLEIETGEKQILRTGGGPMEVYGHAVTLIVSAPVISEMIFETSVYFAKHSDFQRSLLGRGGFLDRIRLGLIHYDGLVFLSRYDE